MVSAFQLTKLNAGIYRHIDDIIVAGQEKRDRTPGTHMSSIIQPESDRRGVPTYCRRQVCLEQDYMPYEILTDPHLIQTFRFGEKVHDMWQEWFANAHAAATGEIERRRVHTLYNLNFTIDILGRVPAVPSGQLYCIDVKGYNEGSCIEHLLADHPPTDARVQINMYLHMLRELYGMNDVLGMILMHNKNGRVLTPKNIAPTQLPDWAWYKWYWVWIFPYSAELAAPYQGRLDTLLADYGKVKAEGRYPARISSCESLDSPRAKRCSVARVCFSDVVEREKHRIAGK